MATDRPSWFFFKEKNALPTKISPYDLKPHPIYRVGAVVVIWWLDLQLHVQSVAITTNVASSNPIHDVISYHTVHLLVTKPY
jgi:hypothetical protein